MARDLVQFDEKGMPFSVHYEQLPPMLLNEMQKQQRTIEEQRARGEVWQAQIAMLLARVDALESQHGVEITGTDR